ncbi:MAG: addiction module protein [Porticoccaceae bacterium]
MSLKLEALEAEVLRLSPSDRTHLLERIIVSLDTDAEVEDAWLREAAHRQAEIESGAVALIPGEEAMNRLRTRLKR